MSLKNATIAVCMVLFAGTSLTLAAERELPPAAKPGECYARVFVPATYTTSTEQMLKTEASQRIEIVPAKYEWGTERVLVKEASTRLEAVPAKYEWIEEKVLIKEAQTVWKEGTGPISKVDGATGEILCLIEEPAVYKTVRKRVLKTPATTRTVEIPAEYKTVKVQKLASSPKERTVQIPAEYTTVTKRSLVTDGKVEWTEILCQTNMSPNAVTQVQRALSKAGFNPGTIDGVIGPDTMNALRSFQRAKGLASGALTMDTLKALNVNIGG